MRAAAAAALADAPRRSGLTPDSGADDDAPEVRSSALSEDELAELIEFFLWGGFRLLPAKGGGGELSEKEQRMLGKVWSRALLPLVEKHSQDAPIVAAVIVTGEVILKRVMLARVSAREDAEEDGAQS